MAAAQMSPSQWFRLSKEERIDLIAYQQLKRRQRQMLLSEVVKKIPGEFGMLAQAIIGALD